MISHDTYLSLIAPLKQRCCCSSPVFQKLVSFNFEDYAIPPTALWDTEILIRELIRNEFRPLDDGIREQENLHQRYECKRCRRICRVTHAEYSISLDRSYARFENDLRAPAANYLLDFRGLEEAAISNVHDFRKREDGQGYIGLLLATSDHSD